MGLSELELRLSSGQGREKERKEGGEEEEEGVEVLLCKGVEHLGVPPWGPQ